MAKLKGTDQELYHKNRNWLINNDFSLESMMENEIDSEGRAFAWYKHNSKSFFFNLYRQGDVLASINVNYDSHNAAITVMLEKFRNTTLLKDFEEKGKKLGDKIGDLIIKEMGKENIFPSFVGVDVIDAKELSYLVKIPGKHAEIVYPQLLRVDEFLHE